MKKYEASSCQQTQSNKHKWLETQNEIMLTNKPTMNHSMSCLGSCSNNHMHYDAQHRAQSTEQTAQSIYVCFS